MNFVKALIECAKDPLAGPYLYGILLFVGGLLFAIPWLALLGLVLVVFGLMGAVVSTIAE